MSNRFKDYHEKLKSNKTVILSDDEINIYSKTSNNEGFSHSHQEWVPIRASQEGVVIENTEKERTILRNAEREQKTKSVADNLSEK